jgi:hypothetical protein
MLPHPSAVAQGSDPAFSRAAAAPLWPPASASPNGVRQRLLRVVGLAPAASRTSHPACHPSLQKGGGWEGWWKGEQGMVFAYLDMGDLGPHVMQLRAIQSEPSRGHCVTAACVLQTQVGEGCVGRRAAGPAGPAQVAAAYMDHALHRLPNRYLPRQGVVWGAHGDVTRWMHYYMYSCRGSSPSGQVEGGVVPVILCL